VLCCERRDPFYPAKVEERGRGRQGEEKGRGNVELMLKCHNQPLERSDCAYSCGVKQFNSVTQGTTATTVKSRKKIIDLLTKHEEKSDREKQRAHL